jgi:heme-degrading monooxygenase HmoA
MLTPEPGEVAMYGTLGRMTPKAGRRDELVAMMSEPPEGEAAKGYRGAYVLKADEGDEVVVAVMYEDKDAYFAMVHDPKTDENFGKVMALLDGEPSWTDGEWLSA